MAAYSKPDIENQEPAPQEVEAELERLAVLHQNETPNVAPKRIDRPWFRRRGVMLGLAGTALVLGIIFGARVMTHAFSHESTDDAFIESRVVQVSPFIQYERGVLGSEGEPGTGYQPREADENRLQLDFMPFVERTIQPLGGVDEIHYFSDVLRRWVGAPDPKNQSLKRKFIFRRDPRDISRVWFYDPELSLYSEIPYRDITRPPMSLRELRAVMRRLKEEGRSGIDESAIFETLNRMRAIEEQAVRETKKTRRERQRRENHRAADQPRSAGTSRIKEVPEPEADHPATERRGVRAL